MPLHKNQNIQLAIDSISSDGNGVGRHEGQVVFVPGAAVGDLLDVKIVKANKRLAYGRIHQVQRAGPGRILPACESAAQCGGCCFWHLTYEAELAAKQGFVEDALRRIGGLETEVEPVLASPQAERYRNKVQLPLQADERGGILYGFYAHRSHRIVPFTDCKLQPKATNALAAFVASLLEEYGIPPYDEAAHRGLVRHLYIRTGTHSGEAMVCLVINGRELPHADEFTSRLVAQFPQVATVVLNHNTSKTNVITGSESTVLYGEGILHDSLCGVPLRLGPQSFSQVNTLAAEQLFRVAARYAAVTPSDVLLDLYCGAGVIGLSMAHDCKQLIGVEIVPEAVAAAEQTAAEMGLANTRFLCEDAGTAAAQLAAEGLRPDVVTVDPPRKGCDVATLQALAAMGPLRIVMVSCNPATLARDLAWLTGNGYVLERVQPADMFPRTKHVECVALLTRRMDG